MPSLASDMEVESKLKELADLFLGRLDDALVEDIKLDVECREWGVAFDTLCQYLYELDIPITEIELNKIEQAANMLFLSDYNLAPLKQLVVSTGRAVKS